MGLVAREIEAAGFSTICLSMIPPLTASAGAPRIAAIEHPFGAPIGLPGDASTQRAVLAQTLAALEAIKEPGGIVNLPFELPPGTKLDLAPPASPPIASYLMRHPWALPRFLNRQP